MASDILIVSTLHIVIHPCSFRHTVSVILLVTLILIVTLILLVTLILIVTLILLVTLIRISLDPCCFTCPEGMAGMSDVNLLSAISGLSADSSFLSHLFFFCLILFFFLLHSPDFVSRKLRNNFRYGIVSVCLCLLYPSIFFFFFL